MKQLTCYLVRPFVCLMLCLQVTSLLAASNFSIEQIGRIPSAIRNGDTVVAHFFIKNLTSSTRKGYVLSGLPANVNANFSSNLYVNSLCSFPLTLEANQGCVASIAIQGPAAFQFSLCNGASCTRASAAVHVRSQTETSADFPYGSAPSGNVCVSEDYYATPETMLGSWAMLQAVTDDIASGELPSTFKGNIVYGVGTAALGNYYGYNNCGGGCNDLNGYCFAIKFNQKNTYQYMLFQSVNIAANENSFDIYMAGGGCGAFCDSCDVFWGTDSIPWTENILNSSCSEYFKNADNINTPYVVTYNGKEHPAKETLLAACTFASADESGFNTQNFTDITFVPVTCPKALTQVTGLALPSTVETIGTMNTPLIDVSQLTEADFSGPTAIKTATTTQMQDCKTPSSGYCGNVAESVPNYEASISASRDKPLLSNSYCEKNPGITGYCSWNNCGSSGSDYCNQDEATCIACGGGAQWCTCS